MDADASTNIELRSIFYLFWADGMIHFSFKGSSYVTPSRTSSFRQIQFGRSISVLKVRFLFILKSRFVFSFFKYKISIRFTKTSIDKSTSFPIKKKSIPKTRLVLDKYTC